MVLHIGESLWGVSLDSGDIAATHLDVGSVRVISRVCNHHPDIGQESFTVSTIYFRAIFAHLEGTTA